MYCHENLMLSLIIYLIFETHEILKKKKICAEYKIITIFTITTIAFKL